MNKRWPDGSAKLSPMQCPHCGSKLDAASTINEETPIPKPRDLTVCFGCGEVLQFDTRLHLEKISAIELAELEPQEADSLKRVQSLIRLYLEVTHQLPSQSRDDG
jgi:hypothetical protein